MATISAINAGGTDTETFTVTIQAPPVTINFNTVKGAYAGLGAVDGTNEALFTLSLTDRGSFTGSLQPQAPITR